LARSLCHGVVTRGMPKPRTGVLKGGDGQEKVRPLNYFKRGLKKVKNCRRAE